MRDPDELRALAEAYLNDLALTPDLYDQAESVRYAVTVGGKRHEDIAWSYPFPIPECPKIEGLVSFFNEKVDIYVDGELQERPNTKWS